jgi:hypothetical protein
MDTLEARGVVAGFLLLATNVPISAVNLMITGDNLSAGVYYVTKYPSVKKATLIFKKNHAKSLNGQSDAIQCSATFCPAIAPCRKND